MDQGPPRGVLVAVALVVAFVVLSVACGVGGVAAAGAMTWLTLQRQREELIVEQERAMREAEEEARRAEEEARRAEEEARQAAPPR